MIKLFNFKDEFFRYLVEKVKRKRKIKGVLDFFLVIFNVWE